jgi:oxygen-independent coproporphyrinogen-3 oxidase
MSSAVTVTPELLARHDRPGPRYTSYPTAVEFTDAFGPDDHAARLDEAAESPQERLSLYVHLPFCAARCSFCGCHVVVTRRPEVASPYLGRVIDEAALVADHLGDRRVLGQYHWGGGTPTFHTPDELVALHEALLEHFEMAPEAEVAVEVDPRETTVEHLEALRAVGFNRLSMGVQDVDPGVQDLIGRHQTWEQTVAAHETARRLGFDSVNVDLIYGLPGQDEDSFAATLERIVTLAPDRLAVYSFAHVPHIARHQRRIDTDALPDRDTKFALLANAIETLTNAGYTQIGMDHFARPSDDLAQALDQGTLSRNFMGYTVQRQSDVIALGSSGISDVRGGYAQGHKRLASYYEAVDAGRLPIERGVRLTADDLVRRQVITELMCNGIVDLNDVGARFELRADEYFANELDALAAPGGPVEEGLVDVDGPIVAATPVGRLFIRNVAMVFDAYLSAGPADPGTRPVFSRTV